MSQPILQCVQIKPLAGQQGAQERYRVVFSDIINFVQSMLATRKCCIAIPFYQNCLNTDNGLPRGELRCARGQAEERLLRSVEVIPGKLSEGKEV